jgi:hypothetical protein
MKLLADLVPDAGARDRRGAGWLLLGVVALAAALAVHASVQGRIDQADREARQREQHAADQQRAREEADDAPEARQRHQDAMRNAYRRTFPLNDVLSAMESMHGVYARSLAVAVDEGLVRVELTGTDADAVAAAVTGLNNALPEWIVSLQRQGRDGNRLVASVEIRDRHRGRAWKQ